MAILLAQTLTTAGTASGTSTVTRTITFSAGSAVNVIVGGGSAQSVTGVADTVNTYTARTTQTDTDKSYKYSAFTANNVAAGAVTITATFSANTAYPWILVQEITGAATSAYDAIGGTFDGNPSVTGTDNLLCSVTAVAQPGLALGFMCGGGTCGPGTGWSFDTFGTNAGWPTVGYTQTWNTSYKAISATGAFNCLWTNSNASDSIALICTYFDQAAAATGGSSLVNGSLVNNGRLVGVLAR